MESEPEYLSESEDSSSQSSDFEDNDDSGAEMPSGSGVSLSVQSASGSTFARPVIKGKGKGKVKGKVAKQTGGGGIKVRITSADSVRKPQKYDRIVATVMQPSLFKKRPSVVLFKDWINPSQHPDSIPAKEAHLFLFIAAESSRVTRNLFKCSGFAKTEDTTRWNAIWSKNMKPEKFKDLLPFQKFNHWPGTWEMGRKDRLYYNVMALKTRFRDESERYQLETDLDRLRQDIMIQEEKRMEKERQREEIGAPALDPDTIELVDHVKKSGSEIYVDKEFPVEGGGDGDVRIAEWVRPKEVAGVTNPVTFADGTEPGDIQQGQLGDCWFLSALSVLSAHPRLLNNTFAVSDEKHGLYVIRLYKNGSWINVPIDNRIPVTRNMRPVFAHSKDDNELWVSLLEKAYAKVHGGYDVIEGGMVHLALVDLTGGASEQTNLASEEAHIDQGTGALWDKLVKYHEAEYLMGCGSPAGSDARVSEEGIVQGHAYALLDVKELDGHKLVKIRNPWGRVEWNGDWSDNWEGWNRRYKAKLGFESGDDGIFWMSFDDWVDHFHNLYVCRVFSDDWYQLDVQGAWEGISAGGCPSKANKDTAKYNPQYQLTLTRPTHMFIRLAQEESRGTAYSDHHIAFFILDKKGYRACSIKKGEKITSSGPFVNRREVSVEFFAKPLHDGPFTIVCCTFKPKCEAKFTLSIHSDQPVALAELPMDMEAK